MALYGGEPVAFPFRVGNHIGWTWKDRIDLLNKSKERMVRKMKKIDKVSKILSWIFGILYIPLSFFSWLLVIASDLTIDATNPLYIGLIDAFCIITFSITFLCIASAFVSKVLRTRGKNLAAIIVLCLPLVIFLLNLILLAFAETLPRIL